MYVLVVVSKVKSVSNVCCNYVYSLNCHRGTKLMFHNTITRSLSVLRTESVSVMDHKLFMAMSSTVLDQKQ